METGIPITQRYQRLVDEFSVIPDDKILCHVWGCGIGAVTGARAKLRKEGYDFGKYPTPGNTGLTFWVVLARPLSGRERLMAEVERLEKLLTEKQEKLKEIA